MERIAAKTLATGPLVTLCAVVPGGEMTHKIFRERSRTALGFSGSIVTCLIGEVLFRHSLGISPPRIA
jgi:hypothetical protein